MRRREYWAWLSSIEGMTHARISKMIQTLRTPEEIYRADFDILTGKVGLDKIQAHQIVDSRAGFNENKFFEELGRAGISFVTVDDKEYPKKLIPYNEKPFFLFYKGRLPDDNVPAVAMIGARACSDYGRRMARTISRELSGKGVQVISGMARGIDTYSAIGALEGGTPTFAILGCGVDVCYPTENIELYNDIVRNGGIISEYPPGTEPISWHFPQRNRIISGLADKILVVEAKDKSGSLITVEWGLEQGKDIWAVPGRVGEKLSSGCNRLIKCGAGIITGPEKLFDELFPDVKYEVFDGTRSVNAEEKILEKDLGMLYSELSLQPQSVYELIEKTGMEYGVIANSLLQLQLMGLVEQTRSNYYARLDK